MRNVFKKWRLFEANEIKSFPYQIFCDMDGVLVDFMKGTLEAVNASLNMPETRANSKILQKLYKKIFDIEGGEIPKVGPEDIGSPQFPDRSRKIKLIRSYMIKLIANDSEHWVDLPAMPDAMELWAYISQYNPKILTAPMQKGSEVGKTWWIHSNLNPAPKDIIMSHDKFNWAVDEEGTPNVLIDDFELNTKPWEGRGGIAILHKTANETISKLEEIKRSF